jgi:hypothetical protein
MSTPEVNTSNRSGLYGELRVYQAQVTQAAASAPSSIRNAIIGGMSDVIFYLEAVTQGRAEATRILADQRYAPAEQYRQAAAVMSKAFAGSAAANKALESAAASARRQLEAALLPKAPKDASDVLILDRKQDIALLLSATGDTPASKVQAVGKQLRKALQTDDALTAYVLAGGPMRFVYAAQGMNPDAVAQEFARVLGEPIDDTDTAEGDARDPIPGALLLSSLQRGGPNTVSGLLAMANSLLYQAQQAWDSWFKMVKNG